MPDASPKVAVVDELPENLQFFKKTLIPLGYQVQLYDSIAVAENALAHSPAQLILLSLNLSENCFKLLENCNNEKCTPKRCDKINCKKTKHSPIIIFLANNENDSMRSICFQLGAADYLCQPFIREEVEVKIKTQLELQRLECLVTELEKKNKKLETLNLSKNRFLSTMSHEIRTPMNGVLGMVDLLRDTPLDKTQHHFVETIYRSGESLLTILNDILDHSKIEAGKLDFESINFNLEQLIDECAAVFSIKSVSSSIELLADVVPGTPLNLVGDPNRIRQIILNLLSNAFKFTPQGQIRLTVDIAASDSIAESVIIKFVVKDAGLGMTEQQTQNLFKPYNQAEIFTARHFGGTGLGLTICKQLTELMQGEIGVNSTHGIGTSLWFTIPLTLQKNNHPGETQINTTLISKRVLIVDVSADYCQMVGSHIEQWGMNYQWCTSLEKASQQLGNVQNLFDVVLFSVTSEIEHGLEVIGQFFKEAKQTVSCKFILVNNGYIHIEPVVLTQHGISCVLEKPFGIGQLQQLLIELFSVKDITLALPSHQQPQFENLRVMVAEDDETNRLVIKSMLHKYNINPIMVCDGERAVAQFIESCCDINDKPDENIHSIDLILMDCEMPELDGFEATKKIRKLEQQMNIFPVPIVALTAHAMEQHKHLARLSGMDNYLTKPLSIKKLEGILSSCATSLPQSAILFHNTIKNLQDLHHHRSL